MSAVTNKPVSMPDAFIILFFVMILAAVASHLVPAGSFTMLEPAPAVEGAAKLKSKIDPNSFTLHHDAAQGAPLFAEGGGIGFFNYAFEGLVSGDKWGSAVGVIAFILLTGGAFGIIMKTGAIHNGILALIAKTQRMDFLFIPLMFSLFSLGGAIFGMGEEAIAFCIVLLPLMLALGYDAITTVLVTYVATQIGFATSWMNPFNVSIAQGIAEIPLMSGKELRIVMWSVFTLFGIIFTMKYAAKIKAKPELSLSFASDQKLRSAQNESAKSQYNTLDSLILLAFFAGLVWIIWGVTTRQYYIPEIASQFFTLGVVIAVIAVIGKRFSMNDAADGFKQGAAELLPAALIVGMAKGIVLLLGGDNAESPSVLNTLLYYSGQALDGLPAYLSAWLMLVIQSVINFFVASGSGQAALTMPLIAPLADLVGLSRQIAVLAFQLGDGLTNCIIPTSAALIGCLGVVRLDWTVWLRFVWKLQLCLFALASAFMFIAVAMAYQ
ncbi:MAG: putative basic amino acid antiporter YfcC [Gammaproteobacteria bacterium]|nr:putative basic amino acid antiporter YfcC [Gammaproteobacteria bacterium]MBU1556510.1 putative basic amino acid antiporter YfcC [Gammaproteobacteria bacterium]MBU2071130.1 putative basic amino acid antiporter YfcC [Gammaproteobacteria bacterium]MBU2183051.1 putative basic amino acid antiporter YfcC [Gammaproteobacteria bacterium]MBU2203189.1 putative basic amino acid antiporter YfcC [Gammaproteobacteria bacterium]